MPATSTVLAILLALGAARAYAQAEIDPDHFDSPGTKSISQSGIANSRVMVTRYDGTFSLSYRVLCNGRELGRGKYSTTVRTDGKMGRATRNQKGHAIEIAGVIQKEASKARDEVVIVESNQHGPTLSLVQARGFAFVFAPQHSADPADNIPARAEKPPLNAIDPKAPQDPAP